MRKLIISFLVILSLFFSTAFLTACWIDLPVFMPDPGDPDAPDIPEADCVSSLEVYGTSDNSFERLMDDEHDYHDFTLGGMVTNTGPYQINDVVLTVIVNFIEMISFPSKSYERDLGNIAPGKSVDFEIQVSPLYPEYYTYSISCRYPDQEMSESGERKLVRGSMEEEIGSEMPDDPSTFTCEGASHVYVVDACAIANFPCTVTPWVVTVGPDDSISYQWQHHAETNEIITDDTVNGTGTSQGGGWIMGVQKHVGMYVPNTGQPFTQDYEVPFLALISEDHTSLSFCFGTLILTPDWDEIMASDKALFPVNCTTNLVATCH